MSHEKNLPKVSIIIVNYNGLKLLERCLNSVVKTTYPSFEIIIVDNNSSDGSLEFVKEHFPLCKTIKLKSNEGFAIANNLGAKSATGSYLAFLNNDAYVKPEWLSEAISAMEADKKIVIAQCMLIKPNGDVDSSGDFATRYGITYSSKNSAFDLPREILSARGAAMIVRRDFYLTEGGFDEDYFIAFEDVELGWKARILGFRVVMVPKALVFHDAGSTMTKMSSMMTFHSVKNQLSLITTHFETQRAIANLLLHVGSLFVAFLALLFRVGLRTDSFTIDKKAAMKGVIWYIMHSRMVWKKHKEIDLARKVSTAELIKIGLISNKKNEN